MSDGDLLSAFVEQRQQEAFSEIVRRHGELVLGVCRSILGNTPDAEDAAQAVFLALIRKAAPLRRHPTLGGCPVGVADDFDTNSRDVKSPTIGAYEVRK